MNPKYKLSEVVGFTNTNGSKRVCEIISIYLPLNCDEWKYGVKINVMVFNNTTKFYDKIESYYNLGEHELFSIDNN